MPGVNIKTARKPVEVTNTSKEFAGHPWSESEWSVSGRTLPAKRIKELVTKFPDSYDEEMFVESVERWSGFVGDGNVAIECNSENRREFYNDYNVESLKILNTFSDEKTKNAVAEAENEKNS